MSPPSPFPPPPLLKPPAHFLCHFNTFSVGSWTFFLIWRRQFALIDCQRQDSVHAKACAKTVYELLSTEFAEEDLVLDNSRNKKTCESRMFSRISFVCQHYVSVCGLFNFLVCCCSSVLIARSERGGEGGGAQRKDYKGNLAQIRHEHVRRGGELFSLVLLILRTCWIFLRRPTSPISLSTLPLCDHSDMDGPLLCFPSEPTKNHHFFSLSLSVSVVTAFAERGKNFASFVVMILFLLSFMGVWMWRKDERTKAHTTYYSFHHF